MPCHDSRPPQRSGLRVCVCVASIHPSWGDGHPTGSSHRSGDSGQVGMAVVLACAVPRHSLRSPGFRIHAGPALCGDRSVPSMGLVARARSCCSRSGIGETVPWTCVAGFLNCQPEMPAVSVTSATAPGNRMVRSDTDLRGSFQWPSSAPGALAPWASAEASPVSTGPRDPATSGTARTAQPCQARTRLGIPAAPRLLAWADINPILGSQLACTDGERRQRHTQPAASRAVSHLAAGAASHSQRRPGPARVCRPFAARCRCAKAKPKSTGLAGARANGRAGHWPPTGSGLADLERPPRTHSSQALLPVPHFFSLSSLSSVCLPFLIPYYPLPTTHTRCEGPIDHLPTTRLDVAAVKWSNPSIQPRLADPTADTDSPPATAEPPTLD